MNKINKVKCCLGIKSPFFNGYCLGTPCNIEDETGCFKLLPTPTEKMAAVENTIMSNVAGDEKSSRWYFLKKILFQVHR